MQTQNCITPVATSLGLTSITFILLLLLLFTIQLKLAQQPILSSVISHPKQASRNNTNNDDAEAAWNSSWQHSPTSASFPQNGTVHAYLPQTNTKNSKRRQYYLSQMPYHRVFRDEKATLNYSHIQQPFSVTPTKFIVLHFRVTEAIW